MEAVFEVTTTRDSVRSGGNGGDRGHRSRIWVAVESRDRGGKKWLWRWAGMHFY